MDATVAATATFRTKTNRKWEPKKSDKNKRTNAQCKNGAAKHKVVDLRPLYTENEKNQRNQIKPKAKMYCIQQQKRRKQMKKLWVYGPVLCVVSNQILANNTR